MKIPGWFFINTESLLLIMTLYSDSSFLWKFVIGADWKGLLAYLLSDLKTQGTVICPGTAPIERPEWERQDRREKPYGLMHNRSKCLSICLSVYLYLSGQSDIGCALPGVHNFPSGTVALSGQEVETIRHGLSTHQQSHFELNAVCSFFQILSLLSLKRSSD